MKIIKLPHSWLFLVVHPENDTVRAYFYYRVYGLKYIQDNQIFDLNKLSLSLVKDFYKNLANDWNRKYRI